MLPTELSGRPCVNSVDPDQLAFKKPADLDIHCFQKQDMYVLV